jgi:hypothetical protein
MHGNDDHSNDWSLLSSALYQPAGASEMGCLIVAVQEPPQLSRWELAEPAATLGASRFPPHMSPFAAPAGSIVSDLQPLLDRMSLPARVDIRVWPGLQSSRSKDLADGWLESRPGTSEPLQAASGRMPGRY